ncbi:hypothetical protein CLI75_12010, partial [Porphyromonas gingivalis]
AHYLLFPDLRHNMDEMAETLLGYCTIHYSDLVGSDKQEVHIRVQLYAGAFHIGKHRHEWHLYTFE